MKLTDSYPIPRSKGAILRQALLVPRTNLSDSSDGEEIPYATVMNNTLFSTYQDNDQNGTLDLADDNKLASEIFIEPHNIGLIPKSEWTPSTLSLEQIQNSYFSKRNGTSRQFDIKLYNALCITKSSHGASKHVGVTWVDSEHFKVNEKIFSHFIGNKSEQTNLFDKMGPLESYGFEQVFKGTNPRFTKNFMCDDVDDRNIRLFKDPMHRFSREKSYARVV